MRLEADFDCVKRVFDVLADYTGYLGAVLAHSV